MYYHGATCQSCKGRRGNTFEFEAYMSDTYRRHAAIQRGLLQFYHPARLAIKHVISTPSCAAHDRGLREYAPC